MSQKTFSMTPTPLTAEHAAMTADAAMVNGGCEFILASGLRGSIVRMNAPLRHGLLRLSSMAVARAFARMPAP
jgi:hypothetical protein